MINPRFVIKAVISGQRLNINIPLTVSGTVNYIGVEAKCSSEWDDCTVVCYIRNAQGNIAQLHLWYDKERDLYFFATTQGFTLPAGKWSIWFVGVKAEDGQEIYRVTTEVKEFEIYPNDFYSSVPVEYPDLAQQAIALAENAKQTADEVMQALIDGDLQGEKGDPGEPAEIGFVQASVDNTTTNPQCTVTVTKDPELDNTYDMQFDFTGIKGVKGDKGNKGDKGDKGDTGAVIDDYVLVQDTQPTSPTNKMWLKPVAGESPIMIPTAEEFQDVEDDVTGLMSAMERNVDFLFVTTDSLTTNGVTIEKINDTSFRVFGTATAGRYITLFNGVNAIQTSTQEPNKIIPAGEYEVTIITNLDSVKLRYSSGTAWSSAVALVNGDVNFVSNVGVCLLTNNNVNYGTEESPTIIDIKIRRKILSESPWILTPSGNDDSAAIWLNLYRYGKCELVAGNYNVYSLTMPKNSVLCGSGNKTILLVNRGVGIYPTSGCTLQDLAMDGGGEDDVIPSEEGGRSGIVIAEANLRRVRVENCYIHGFSGSAIVARDIGTGIRTDIVISRCNLWYNFRGLYIRRDAEFIMTSDCNICCNYYGVLNRGGNNKFSNCDIDSNIINMQIDQDEGSNGGHGSIIGCSFNHSNNRQNDGYSLIIKDTGRELISACNILYGKTRLENTNGNILTGCAFGQNSGIEVVGGACSIFNGCSFRTRADVSITLTDNDTTVFLGCYTRQGQQVQPDSTGE